MRRQIPTRTFTRLTKLALTLPEGIGMLTHQDNPAFPIDDYWVVYLIKAGTGNRPPLRAAAGQSEGIVDIGRGWKLAICRISEEEMFLADAVVKKVQGYADQLLASSVIYSETN
jgi:hypothetical protein